MSCLRCVFSTAVCNPPCLNGGTCASPLSTCHCILSKYEGPQCQKRKIFKI